jgi:hypothetical protein
MKSCRNCAHSRHDGSAYRPSLICPLWAGTSLEVVVRFSASIEENKQIDAKAQAFANQCKAYTPEGESK